MLFRVILALVIFLIALGSFPVAAQELPASYGFGMLVAKGESPVPAGFVTLHQNLKEIKGESGATKMQFYISGSTMYLDDYYFDRVDANVLGIEGVPTLKLFANKVTLAVGVGARWEVASGDDGLKWPVVGEVGWRIVPEYASINFGFSYIPMNQHRADYWFPSVSVGLDGPKVLTAFTSWLTR